MLGVRQCDLCHAVYRRPASYTEIRPEQLYVSPDRNMTLSFLSAVATAMRGQNVLECGKLPATGCLRCPVRELVHMAATNLPMLRNTICMTGTTTLHH